MNTNEVFGYVAEKVGEYLCKKAYWSKSRCTWLSPKENLSEGFGRLTYQSLESDLYEGLSGISLFLAYLYHVTKKNIYHDTSIGALKQAFYLYDDISPSYRFSVFSGKMGVIYTSFKLSRLLNDYDLFRIDMLNQIFSNFDTNHFMDIMGGNAGAIPALLEINKAMDDKSILNAAIRLGDELINTATKENDKWSWDYRANGIPNTKYNLTGYSHGSAGIGASLLSLYKETNYFKYLDASRKAFNYEKYWFSIYNNWPDFRPSDNESAVKFPLFWCHGSPGIGLSRLYAYKAVNDDHYKEECFKAIEFMMALLT